MDFFHQLFSTDGFMPHGMCYEWKPGIIWLHVVSDAIIAFAYYAISLILIFLVRKRTDLRFRWMFVCFAVFIVACGTTHLLEIVNIWHPTYWLSGDIKAITAFASIITALLLARLIPRALAIPSAEAIREQALILNLINDSIFTRDLGGKIRYWNEGARRIYGWSPQEAAGQITHELLQTRFPEPLEKIQTKLLSEGHWEGELTHTRRNGTPLTVASRWTLQRDQNQQPLAVIELNHDITDRKRIERALESKNAELEAANKELEAFSYSVSHDLRAPLRTVDGFSQAVLEDYGPQLPADGARQLKIIREGAQHMGVLIDDLLAFSRLSRVALKKETLKTDDLVRAVLGDVELERHGRRIEFRIGYLPPCQADPSLLKQVWMNLLSNAIKYTRLRDPATIDIGCTTEREKVYFVRDNGAGFDMRYVHKLFGVFQRLHRADQFEGTGVGLAIVQRVVHRHGGRVWAEAVLDAGATFYFTLGEETI